MQVRKGLWAVAACALLGGCEGSTSDDGALGGEAFSRREPKPSPSANTGECATGETSSAPQAFALQSANGTSATLTLECQSDGAVVFDLSAVAKTGNSGAIQRGRAAITSQTTAEYWSGADCVIAFAFRGDEKTIDVAQTGDCVEEARFDASVDVGGHYVRP